MGKARTYWAVVETKHREERRAVCHLERQEFHVYFPLMLVETVSRGTLRRGLHPLFPGYLFVRVRDQWRSITGTRGVSRVVMQGEQPGRVAAAEIEYLRSLENERGEIVLPPAHSVGDPIRVTTGAYEGFRAIVKSNEPAGRVAVLLHMLGREVRVVFDGKDVASAA